MLGLNFLSKRFDKRHKFNINDQVNAYTIIDQLGEGRFGMVYLGTNVHQQKVVIKQLKRDMLLRDPKKVEFEANILKDLMVLKDSRFPKYIDDFQMKYRRGYILEYKEGRTIEAMIYKENYKFSRKEIYNFSLQLLDMISLLQQHGIVHKDIRVSNVILTDNGQLALIDFGLARYIDHTQYKKDLDYWYLADFLIHLYYTTYEDKPLIDKPWYEQLDLSESERVLLKRLMKIDPHIHRPFTDIDEIRTLFLDLLAQQNRL